MEEGWRRAVATGDRQGGSTERRTWARALLIGLAITAGILALAVTVNPLLGRVVHWEIVGVMAPVILAVSVVSFRRG